MVTCSIGSPQECRRQRGGENRDNQQGNENAGKLLLQPAAARPVAKFPDADQHDARPALFRAGSLTRSVRRGPWLVAPRIRIPPKIRSL